MTIGEALALALQAYQAGKMAETELLCRQILEIDGSQAIALHLLGLTAHQAGRLTVAREYMRQAVALSPQLSEFHSNLGVVCQALGQWGEALACYEQAVRLRPEVAAHHHKLGNAQAALGRLEDALASLREARRLQPDYAEVHNDLATVLKRMGRLGEAEPQYRAALRLQPNLAEAHNNLGTLLAELGRLDEALASYQQALRLNGNFPEAHNNIGDVFRQLGRFAEAEASCRQAVRLRPDVAQFHCNLGQALAVQGRYEELVASCREAIRLRPDLPAMYHNFAYALLGMNRPNEALAVYEQAAPLFPNSGLLVNSLANLYRDRGRMDEAIACYRKALALAPEMEYVHSNLLLALHYHPDYDPDAVFAEHLEWARQFEGLPPLHAPSPPTPLPLSTGGEGSNVAPSTSLPESTGSSSASVPSPPYSGERGRGEGVRDPGRRLRIGYVSGDFREHVMGRYSEAIVAAHHRDQVEVFCYANIRKEDERTQRLKAVADHWRSILGMSDVEAANLIVADQIDLLIDLAGHTGGNRLGVFAHKPAPIQVTHCGYPATTGLSAIDYRLMDPYTDPPGRTERFHSEKLMRLPEAHWCYAPPSTPEVNALPAREPGYVTFGSFNLLAKITEPMIELWAQVLKELPESRLRILVGAGTALDERLRAGFGRHGIDLERITALTFQRGEAYYRFYHDVDICLDTYPYVGCNTTADALWMGVPVVTRAGPSCVTRLGVSALALAGLEDLVTESPAAYVETAVRLARDLPRLRELRIQLRDRVKRTLSDVARFTRQLEAAYRQMWQAYCEGSRGS